MTDKEFEGFLSKKKDWYKSIGSVVCPLLQQEITFNSKGFHHLLFNGLGHSRSKKEKMRRLYLLKFVIPIIHNPESVLTNYSLLNKIQYWSLQKVVEGKEITVILRKIGNGNITFYSVFDKK